MPIQVLSRFVRGTSLDNEASRYIGEALSKRTEKEDNTYVAGSEICLPDIEIMSLATSATNDLKEHKLRFSKFGVVSFLTTLLRPWSRGTIRPRSSNPHDRSKVDLGLLSDPADFAIARKAVRLAMKLGDTIKAQGFPLLRGLVVPESNKVDKDLDRFIRHRARTTYHYSST